MSTFKYVLSRIALMLVVFVVTMVLCFCLIRLLPFKSEATGQQAITEQRRLQMLGWADTDVDGNKITMIEKLGKWIYNILFRDIQSIDPETGEKTKIDYDEETGEVIPHPDGKPDWDWGVSLKIDYLKDVTDVVGDRMTPTILLNVYSLLISIPIGIAFGIFAALKKNKWQDHFISTAVMLFISVPSFVYAFLLQYFFAFKWGILPAQSSSLMDAGGSYFSWEMSKSLILPVLSMSFGTIAGLTRSTRAELTEALTSEYMLLARTKGLTKSQSIMRHALKNAMVPILPGIISSFVGILSGSYIIEQIFGVPGVGKLYIMSINMRDYDLFMFITAFYGFIGLLSNILIDLSYGFLDPRVKMILGQRKLPKW